MIILNSMVRCPRRLFCCSSSSIFFLHVVVVLLPLFLVLALHFHVLQRCLNFSFLPVLQQVCFNKFYIDAFHYLIDYYIVALLCFYFARVPNKYAFVLIGFKFSNLRVFPFYVTLASKHSEVLGIGLHFFP
jgi:hypothetical protein